jgi:hypothetical protein
MFWSWSLVTVMLIFYLLMLVLIAAVHSLPLQSSHHLEQSEHSLTISTLGRMELVRRGNGLYQCAVDGCTTTKQSETLIKVCHCPSVGHIANNRPTRNTGKQ